MDKYFNNFFIILVVIIISILFGYVFRMYHEANIQKSYQFQAEMDLATLEEEFYSALENPHSFYIFNGRFEVYPIKYSGKRFHYRQSQGR